MAQVFLGIGSNIERERHLNAGLDALLKLFGEPALSSVYDSPAVGFDGQPFLNLVAQVHTSLSPGRLAAQLRQVEFDYGRPANASRFSSRRLDIDILTYDDLIGEIEGVQLPRDEILYNAFVLRPLAELAPGAVHPERQCTYHRLWAEYPPQQQPIRRVDFSWHGRTISTRE
ncbi:MAG: 2-amino-4-hydroxy-6-hydroxymethyldihydropteridine diphosphokinase [Pseudomonadota bacterium]